MKRMVCASLREQSEPRLHRKERPQRRGGVDGIFELDEKREVDADERDQKYYSQIEEAVDLLGLFASYFELVSGRQAFSLGHLASIGPAGGFRMRERRDWKAKDGNGAEMFAAPNSSGLEIFRTAATESSGTRVFCCEE